MPAPSARFSRRRENFDCAHCGARVIGSGYTNHCSACLWSRHVDIAPGDRLAECRGLMEPIGVLFQNGEYVVVQRCVDCGHLWRNRASPDDDPAVLRSLMGRTVPDSSQRKGR